MAERLRKRLRHKPDLATGRAHNLCRGGVFGNFLRQRLDAAGSFKVGAPPKHGLTLRETKTEHVGDILPARLIGVEERAFDLGPNSARPRTNGRRSDQPGIGAPACKQQPQIIRRHQYVCIGEYDPFMLRGSPPFKHVIELRIVACSLVADEQSCARVRMLGHQRMYQRNYGIGWPKRYRTGFRGPDNRGETSTSTFRRRDCLFRITAAPNSPQASFASRENGAWPDGAGETPRRQC